MKSTIPQEIKDACNEVRKAVSKMSQEERATLVDSFLARVNGDVSKKDIIMEQINVDKRVMSILESMYDMTQSEDWDETSAQLLIMNGSSLYVAIKNDL